MKKLWTTLLKDAKLSFKGLYFYIEIGLAVIFILIMVFIVPENFDSNRDFYIYLNLENKNALDVFLEEFDFEEEMLVDSREMLEEKLNNNKSSVGLEIKEVNSKLTLEIVLQGYESESLKRFIKAELEGYFVSQEIDMNEAVEFVPLQSNAETISDKENIIPIYLTMNIALMGLFIIAAYIFLDKEEGLVKAYAVAPVSIWQYLLSKILIILVMGLATSFLTVFVLMRFDVNYVWLFGLVLAFNLFGSSLGILITSYFKTMTQAMGSLYFVIIFLMLGTISYFAPSFNPFWIKIMPTYSMLFSFQQLLLNNGDKAYMLKNIGIFIFLSACLFTFATARFRKSLTV
ncbi:MAG: ABC transporter permease [Clostridia bacterium]